MRCDKFGALPCVWNTNKQSMIIFTENQNEEEAKLKQQCFTMYHQMALIINGGVSGCGNRLPECVLADVWEMFPDPDQKYTGHWEVQ